MAVSDLRRFYGGSPDSWQWGGETEKAARDTQAPKGLKKNQEGEDEEGEDEEGKRGTIWELEGQKGRAGSTIYPQRRGPADFVGLRRDASSTYDEARRSLPVRRDPFGNPITTNTQYGTGPDTRFGRIYDAPGEVAGGYFRSYGQLGQQLGHDPNVFASSGGFIGRGSRAAGISEGMRQLSSIASNPNLKDHANNLAMLYELQRMLKQYFSMGDAPTPGRTRT